MRTSMEHIHRDTATVLLLPGALPCRSADLMHDHFATETCPACGYDEVDTLTTETRPAWHECRQNAATRWGHDCWHCHDAPSTGYRCPVCGLRA